MTTPAAFFDLAEALLDCVCAQMTEIADTDADYAGCPCAVFVSNGPPAHDFCCEPCDGTAGGQVTVHVETVYPSDNFPDPSETYEPCRATTWVAALTVTVVRCAPIPDEQGRVDPTENAAVARTQSIDAYAALQALSCCLGNDAPPGRRNRRIAIQGSTAAVEAGGCASVTVSALVEAGRVCGCTAVS